MFKGFEGVWKKTVIATAAACMVFGISGCTMGDSADNAADEISASEFALEEGVIATYRIVTEDADEDDIDRASQIMFQRIKDRCKEWNFTTDEDEITVEIPMDTTDLDIKAILEDLGMTGELLFLDEENYDAWSDGDSYEALLTGDDIESANASTSTDAAGVTQHMVSLEMTDEGTGIFAEATKANIGKTIYIIFDGEVVSAPKVMDAILNGSVVITGLDSLEEAEQIASVILSGMLPIELELVDYETVSEQDILVDAGWTLEGLGWFGY